MSWVQVISQWSGPAGFMVLLGAVVWGVQLNVAVLRLTEKDAAQDMELAAITQSLTDISRNSYKASVLLDELMKDTLENTKHIESHSTEAEEWKRRILLLEQQLKLR